ncbi:MAG: peptidylprolyl isomerase [Sumerlaeia bacterium]
MMQQLRDPRVMKFAMWSLLILTIPAFVLLYGDFNQAATTSGGFEDREYGTIQTARGEVPLDNDRMLAARRALADRYMLLISRIYGQQPTQALQSRIENMLSNKEIAEFAVTQEALQDLAERVELRVSDQQLATMLKDQGVTRDMLDNYLRQQGMTETQFLRSQKSSLQRNRVQGLVTSVARPSLLELWQEWLLANEKITAEYARIPVTDFEARVETTEDELREYFEENPEQFVKEEERVYRYVKLAAPPQTPEGEITGEMLRAAYEALDPQADSQFFGADPLIVRHIQLDIEDGPTTDAVRQEAQALREQIASGERDMADAADFESDDMENIEFQEEGLPTTRGGVLAERLTTETRRAMVERYGGEWYKTVAGLEPGEVSPVFESGGAFYIARVEDTGGKRSFGEVRRQLEARLRSQRDRDWTGRRAESINEAELKMREAAAEATSIEGVARAVEAEVGQTSPTMLSIGFIAGVGDLSQFTDFLSDMQLNELSPALRTPQGDIVVLQVKEILEERPYEFAEVKDRVERSVKREKAVELAREKAEELKAMVKAGDNFTSATEKVELATYAKVGEPFTRMEAPGALGQAPNFPSVSYGLPDGDLGIVEQGFGQVPLAMIVFKVLSEEEPPKKDFLADLGDLETRYRMDKGSALLEEFRRDAVQTMEAKFDESLVTDGSERRRRGEG